MKYGVRWWRGGRSRSSSAEGVGHSFVCSPPIHGTPKNIPLTYTYTHAQAINKIYTKASAGWPWTWLAKTKPATKAAHSSINLNAHAPAPTTKMTITIPLRRRASARGRRRRRRHRIPLSSRPQPQQGDRWLQEGESSPHLPPSTAYSLVTTGGSHFLTLAVGTPPQPQAVIVDTGSTLTAFGCVPGCDVGCGTHTYPFFALDKSSSARTLTCGECGTQCLDDKCLVSQRYSEGSSWRAFSVEDRVGLMGMGGTRSAGQQQADDSAASGANDTIPFVFGCQTKLTYVFKRPPSSGFSLCILHWFVALTYLFSSLPFL